MSRTRRAAESCWAAGLPAALALGLLVGAWSSPTAFPVPLAAPGATANAAAPSGLRLAVEPTAWWMVAGNSTDLEATWVDIPPGCTNVPVEFHWSILAGWDEGMFTSPLGASTARFTAASVATGTAEVEVRSATILDCGGEESAAFGNATAHVTVVAPPRLGALAFDTDPVRPGTPTNLTGSLAAGAPPYRVRVTWGDGSSSSYNLSTPGPFEFPHRFASGTFVPAVSVEDSAGLTVHGAAEEPLDSGSNLTVGIEASRYSTEVGLTVEFEKGILDPPSTYSEVTVCSDALGASQHGPALGALENATDAGFNCTFATPGSAEVAFEVIPYGVDVPPANVTLTLPVAATLGLGVRTLTPSTEAGVPATVAVNVSGGVPPFTVRWGLSGTPNGTSAALGEDGILLVPIDPPSTGSFGVTVVVSDSAGVEAMNSTAHLAVDGELRATANASTSPLATGSAVYVSGAVTQGVAPFLWFVAPSVVPANETAPEGNLSVVAGFAWSGRVPSEGSASLTVGVVDADGALWSCSLPVALVPRLDGAAELAAVPGTPTSVLVLNLTLTGGLPPFAVWTNSSGRAQGNASAASDGAYSWSWPVNATGPLPEDVVVVDRLGVRWSENTTVNFSASSRTPGAPPPPPAPAPPGPLPAASNGSGVAAEAAGLSVLLLLLAAGGALYWRRRRAARAAPPTPLDPVAVVRRIIEPADGVDRATVELLAEEAGLPLPAIRATLGRLVSEGRLRSETGTDGEEVFAWSPRDRD